MKFDKYKKLLATKPFYRKYNYRIKTVILSGFHEPYLAIALNPSKKLSGYSRYNGYNQEYVVHSYPRTQEEVDHRLAVYEQITSIVGKKVSKSSVAKVRNDSTNTTIYITDEATYNKIMAIPSIKTYIIDVCEPAFADYAAVKSKLDAVDEIRSCLYFRRHRYKVCLRSYGELKDVLQFRELATANPEVFISPSLRDVHKKRFWQYQLMSVTCDDESTASYLSMIGGDMVVSVKRAVLVDELK
jgi:hypothetical protein